MTDRQIELIYFEGCPNAKRARENLRAALERVGHDSGQWSEWNLESAGTPERFKAYGSPTVLVDGLDVTGGAGEGSAMSCRADGAPSIDTILRAVQAASSGSSRG